MAFNAKRYQPEKFVEGVWAPILGGRFKIARAGNPVYERALEESGYRRKKDPEERERALMQAIATGILRDWEDVQDANSKDIPYSVENAVEVLAENPDLVQRILERSNDLSMYVRQDEEEQAKKR